MKSFSGINPWAGWGAGFNSLEIEMEKLTRDQCYKCQRGLLTQSVLERALRARNELVSLVNKLYEVNESKAFAVCPDLYFGLTDALEDFTEKSRWRDLYLADCRRGLQSWWGGEPEDFAEIAYNITDSRNSLRWQTRRVIEEMTKLNQLIERS